MAFTYGFYNGIDHDRKYNAEQISALFDGLITDGVFDSIGEHFSTVAGEGLQVLVKSGKAWFDHTWSVNDAAMPLSIANPDVTLSRYDAVVLEVNKNQEVRANSIKVITGVPATNPVKPSMIHETNLNQYPLAYILVEPAIDQITASMIQIVVGTSVCPFVTGIVQSTDIDDLFNQWSGEFSDWFDNLKAQLSDDVVTNLYSLIEGKVDKVEDKATEAEALAGVVDDKYMTPLLVQKSVEENVFKVGDVLTTQRTLSNNKWKLCNGATFAKTSYPEFFSIRPAGYTGAKHMTTADMPKWCNFPCFFVDGSTPYIVTVGKREEDSYYLYLYIQKINTSGNASLTYSVNIHSLVANGVKRNYLLRKIGTEYYLIVISDDSSASINILKSTSLGGTYSRVNVLNTSTYKICDFWKDDNTNNYILVTQDDSNSYPRVWYTTNPSGTWTNYTVPVSGKSSFMFARNTQRCVICYDYSSYLRFAQTDNILNVNSWSNYQGISTGSMYSSYVTLTNIHDDSFVVVGNPRNSLTSFVALYIKPDNTTTSKTISSLTVNYAPASNIYESVYFDDTDEFYMIPYTLASDYSLLELKISSNFSASSIGSSTISDNLTSSRDLSGVYNYEPSRPIIYNSCIYVLTNTSTFYKIPIVRFPNITSSDTEKNYIKVK